jgi:mannose-1-phosphate guanylyltransferase
MIPHAYAVVMAGGKGERFWPLSTHLRPKQMLTIFGGKPLVAKVVEYIGDLVPTERTLVVTRSDLLAATRDALPAIPAQNVIGEPFGRDTAAAVTVGTALVKARDPEGLVCVLTADHVIADAETFRRTLREGLDVAHAHDALVTIGITPRFPSTAYGYIEAGDPLPHAGTVSFFAARRFVEKPDEQKAREYLAAGNYNWNSGMFLWSVATFRRQMARHRPRLLQLMDRIHAAAWTPEFASTLEREYASLEKISIDYALMEKADRILMARGTFGWDDVGSWTSLTNHFPADANGNVVIGACEAVDGARNIVVSEGRLTALLAVEDLVVVQAPGVTLVCRKDRVQDVRRLVQHIAGTGRHPELL